MYRFYRYRGAVPWALVLKSQAAVPESVDLQDWELSFERTWDQTNADVRREVDDQGYCLIQSECSFEDLARELGQASCPEVETLAEPRVAEWSPAEFDFYGHRTRTRWRLVLGRREGAATAADIADWRFSRTRTAEDTSPAVRREIARRGYCMFKIGCSFAQLALER